MASPVIRPIQPSDHADWARLFAAYRDFYELSPDDAVVERVWSWICDPAHETSSLIAEIDGDVVGIANYRAFARPSTGTTGLWLDDLYADPAYRGRRVGWALINRLQEIAQQQGYSVVRWITAESNHTAQALYDRIATRTPWVTYDAAPLDS